MENRVQRSVSLLQKEYICIERMGGTDSCLTCSRSYSIDADFSVERLNALDKYKNYLWYTRLCL